MIRKFFIILLFLISVHSGNSQNTDSLLLLYYPFNGNANDASGNNYHGTVYNATLTADRHGIPNKAYSFNGINSYIEFPDIAALKPPLPMSFSTWIKFEDYSQQYLFFFTTDYTEDMCSGVWANLTANDGYIAVGYGDGTPNSTGPNNRRSKIGTTQLLLNTWYFVVLVVRGPQDMDIYINCENDGGSYSGSGGALAYTSNPGNLGKHDLKFQAPFYFLGTIDDFRYWARALTPEDIAVLCDPAGIEESTINDHHHFMVYPNPVDDILHIVTKAPPGFFRYRIVNILGENVDSGTLQLGHTTDISIESLPAGMYVININDGVNELSSTFIKH
jgi:hypothetical protein